MKTKMTIMYDFFAVMLALAFTALSLTGCPPGPDSDPSGPITYTVAQTGGTDGTVTSTGIQFIFSGSVDSLGLTAADITVGGKATKGANPALNGSGTSWTLPITVTAAGTASVKIIKNGVEATTKSITVYYEGQTTPTETVSITWNLNGGSAGTGNYPAKLDKGDTLAEPSPDPTKAGKTFGGWYTNSALTQAYSFASAVNANLNLYAKWEDDDSGDAGGPIIQTQVTFYLNVGTWYNGEFTRVWVQHGGKITRPADDPERYDGYDFTGWYTEPECVTLYDFNLVFNSGSPHSLYAGWYGGSGSDGDFTFEYTSSTLTITDYTGDGGDVNIPLTIEGKPVTAIGESVFSEKRLTSVIIPESVTTIGDNAFYRNPLTAVIIPDNVISIGYNAFANNQLTSVTIGNSVTEIGNGAFSENKLSTVIIPDSVISIGDNAFANNQLTSITIPDSVTSIGGSAFASNQLTSITIGADVTLNDNYYGGPFGDGFDNTYLNTYHRIAGTYTRPDTDSTDWTHTAPPEYIVSGTAPFTILGYFGNGGDVTIPSTIDKKTITAIGDSAFRARRDNNGAYVNQLTSVTIPDSVTTIGGYAFYENQITSITIGAGVTLNNNYYGGSFGDGFETAYYENYEMKGTYTRPDTDSTTWTKQ